MTHPKTRAERRNHRRRIISSALSKTSFLHLFARHCSCWPQGHWARPASCKIHDAPDITTRRQIAGYAKTGPRNWINDMEPEWMYSGIIRKDFRAGGGRRRDEWGCKRGRWAGRFYLPLALSEWESDILSGMAKTPDMIEIVHEIVGPYVKGDVIKSERLPDDADRLLLLGAVVPSDRKNEKISKNAKTEDEPAEE